MTAVAGRRVYGLELCGCLDIPWGGKSKKRSARLWSLPGKRHTLGREKQEKVCPAVELAWEKTYPRAGKARKGLPGGGACLGKDIP